MHLLKKCKQEPHHDVSHILAASTLDVRSNVTINTDIVEGVLESTARMKKNTSKGAGDAGLHEEGGHSENGTVVHWKPGPKKDGKNGKASIPLFNGVDTPDPANVDAIWHVHTDKKTLTVNTVDGREEYKVGGSGPSTRGTNADTKAHSRMQTMGFKGVSIVSGGNKNRVHFYNGSGSYYNVSYSRFKKMAKKR